MNIKLAKGRIALIDDGDAWVLETGRSWCCNGKYVMRISYTTGVRRTEYLHRLILGLESGSKKVDHINGDGLDNRRCNLRIATHRENIRNRRRNSNNTSGYKGVSWHGQCSKWTARIKTDVYYKSLGLFSTKEAAHAAYCAAAQKYHGSFARGG